MGFVAFRQAILSLRKGSERRHGSSFFDKRSKECRIRTTSDTASQSTLRGEVT